MKEMICNVMYDKEVGPVEVKCTLLTTVKAPKDVKQGEDIVIIKEESEEYGTRYSIWDKKDYIKFVKNYEEKEK